MAQKKTEHFSIGLINGSSKVSKEIIKAIFDQHPQAYSGVSAIPGARYPNGELRETIDTITDKIQSQLSQHPQIRNREVIFFHKPHEQRLEKKLRYEIRYEPPQDQSKG